jgi:hemerythrin-like metal-binding protein
MICVEWIPKFDLGISEIDTQHKQLISIMNKLCNALNNGEENKIIAEIIKEMWSYAHYHFELEEKYFDEFHYEKTEEHKAWHRAFYKKVEDLAKDFDKGGKTVAIDAISFLGRWFIDHTQTFDREYVPMFHKNGL